MWWASFVDVERDQRGQKRRASRQTDSVLMSHSPDNHILLAIGSYFHLLSCLCHRCLSRQLCHHRGLHLFRRHLVDFHLWSLDSRHLCLWDFHHLCCCLLCSLDSLQGLVSCRHIGLFRQQYGRPLRGTGHEDKDRARKPHQHIVDHLDRSRLGKVNLHIYRCYRLHHCYR